MATCRTGTPAAARPTAASKIGRRSARQRMNVTVISSVCAAQRQGAGGRRGSYGMTDAPARDLCRVLHAARAPTDPGG
jgi:hypothetical protein